MLYHAQKNFLKTVQAHTHTVGYIDPSLSMYHTRVYTYVMVCGIKYTSQPRVCFIQRQNPLFG